ncbi:MAG: glucosaminidase domain-containing protein [Muribaculaceae bacterium]|nr:glucosaminidase domain-containing protein [Muribaculaceae bacterium]
MIRKPIYFLIAMCMMPMFNAFGASDIYCISSEKLTEINEQKSSAPDDMQRAYDELLNLLISKDAASSDPSTAGCVTSSELAQICKNIWDENTTKCEDFIYSIIDHTTMLEQMFGPMSPSTVLAFSDFSKIDPEIFNQAFNKAVARRGQKNVPSKLQDKGDAFLSAAQQTQINPFVSAAISLYESGRGTSPLARSKNNIAGLGGPGRWMSFTTVEDSIQRQAITLQNKVKKGQKTLESVACAGSYCATNTNTWLNHVSSVVKELYRFYNSLISGK